MKDTAVLFLLHFFLVSASCLMNFVTILYFYEAVRISPLYRIKFHTNLLIFILQQFCSQVTWKLLYENKDLFLFFLSIFVSLWVSFGFFVLFGFFCLFFFVGGCLHAIILLLEKRSYTCAWKLNKFFFEKTDNTVSIIISFNQHKSDILSSWCRFFEHREHAQYICLTCFSLHLLSPCLGFIKGIQNSAGNVHCCTFQDGD